jgi:hypothetical protein
MRPPLMTDCKDIQKLQKNQFRQSDEIFKKQEFSTFPQEFSTGCGKKMRLHHFTLQSYTKTAKKQNFGLKLWKSMWMLLITGKKIHCGKLFSMLFDRHRPMHFYWSQ